MHRHDYWVYILSSASHVLYAGMTNSLERRLQEHKQKVVPEFTARYNVNRLVYAEHHRDVMAANGRRSK